ncbi:MAG: hypothetical protein ACYCU0_15870 [Solirubrobacteraceae bacterium]
MQDQRTLDPDERLDGVERAVLYLLAGERGEQPIWSIEDLGRELESEDDADVAVRTLRRSGLVHTTSEGFVFASRAGARGVRMIGHVS